MGRKSHACLWMFIMSKFFNGVSFKFVDEKGLILKNSYVVAVGRKLDNLYCMCTKSDNEHQVNISETSKNKLLV